ncbi:peptidoglycan DD-metalloendopeptidase family protein [Vibrio coralliilyticus]|uniref:peptidoglycan DD-metalloendopeptidase family protein n=1 Tax=Vibrio coralliilyticus TaxID=190893 RepID=UPI0003912D24|nr:peptidoglycan DD-metalloendopeptidase family protein [Vibrio coralliilyticus]ERB66161.1 peptidase M23 [Vibrio coralliilyticus OCN008]MCC2523032.1 peptidoglycan DD-metalloendopeptidase family protein [Vibrio coralliilyticus]NOH52331.1 peptidoglycan DD-metalloendopeptidase family protein [Vibrio coralliilyticus]NRF29332.1 peptidoglycan DD-metalloendopeptidase family protein [Vibrio coralliilyticus]NRF52452.1 peptidoglycan DD-metalloendopeptidase family protein [Vibrio coralliilyticus]
MLSIFARLPWMHRACIALFSALIVIALFLPSPQDLRPDEKLYEVGEHYPIAINAEALISSDSENTAASLRWEKHTIGSGDSMALLFQRAGLSSRLLYDLTTTSKEIKQQLTRVRPGDSFQFGFDTDDQLVQIKRQLNAYETFLITRSETGFTSQFDKKEVHYQYNYAEADITSNFWNAGVGAGLTANQIMELAGIFGWDIDFALDIRKGDHFEILYQERVVEGEVVGRGKIIAAIFTNQGDTFKAIINDKNGNYYDENGRAMKKAFLRSPLDFRRVSSNFNPRRRHPVTGKVRAHRGTDYAAPVGTPIWAAGDGIVQKSSYNQFNGNYVFIKHSNTYITKYLHLTKRTVKTGQRVKQGQTIGTLGGTGRVTGPHLHYEFLVNGVHKNPRTVKLPQSKSLTGKDKATFIANAKLRLEKLDRYGELLATR